MQSHPIFPLTKTTPTVLLLLQKVHQPLRLQVQKSNWKTTRKNRKNGKNRRSGCRRKQRVILKDSSRSWMLLREIRCSHRCLIPLWLMKTLEFLKKAPELTLFMGAVLARSLYLGLLFWSACSQLRESLMKT